MNPKKILLWTIPLLILPSLLFTGLLQRSFEHHKQAGWLAVHLEDRDVYAILFDAQQRVWAATDKGVSVLDGDGGDWTTYNEVNGGLADDRIRQIVLDHRGRIWAAAGQSVNLFDGTRWTTSTPGNAALSATPQNVKIAIDPQDRIWAYYPGSRTAGVSVLDGPTWITYTADNSGLVSDHITTIAFDGQNRVWIGTWEGLSVFDGETWTTYTTTNSGLLHDHIFTIAFDRQDRAWIGAEGTLTVFDGRTWQAYPIDRTPVTGNQYGGPYVIMFDEQNRAWLGIHGGVNVLDSASGDVVLRDSDSSTVQVILFDKEGRAWLGSHRSPVVRVFTGETWFEYTDRNSGVDAKQVRALAVDHEGRVWIGSSQGIRVLDPAVARPLSDRAVAMSRFLAWGGHAFLPLIIVGLWLGLWRDALPGVGAGMGVGLLIFLLGIVVAGKGGEILLTLGCLGTLAGIVGALVGSITIRRMRAARTEGAVPAGDASATVMGILGGGGCAIVGIVAVVACVVLSCLAILWLMMEFGIGMQ